MKAKDFKDDFEDDSDFEDDNDFEDDSGFEDTKHCNSWQLLDDLRASGISFAITCIASDGFHVRIGVEAQGSATERHFCASTADVKEWLSNKACELYPDSQFAAQYEPPYRSPYVLGSPEARAAGCICPGIAGDGFEYFNTHCPEHGRSGIRMLDGQPTRVGKNWRPGRSAIKKSEE